MKSFLGAALAVLLVSGVTIGFLVLVGNPGSFRTGTHAGTHTVRQYRPGYACGEYQADEFRLGVGCVTFRDASTGKKVVLMGTVEAVEN